MLILSAAVAPGGATAVGAAPLSGLADLGVKVEQVLRLGLVGGAYAGLAVPAVDVLMMSGS